MITALVVFLITSVFVGLTQVPRIPINRPGGALITVITITVGILVPAAGIRVSHGATGADRAAAPGPKTFTVVPADPGASLRTFAVVLVCDDDASRTRGLQGFRPLATDEAAVFVFDPPQRTEFWMASVAYPIDIIYVDAKGRVRQVHRNLRPGSRETFPSRGPVRWAIETAARSGIRPGDQVLFGPRRDR